MTNDEARAVEILKAEWKRIKEAAINCGVDYTLTKRVSDAFKLLDESREKILRAGAIMAPTKEQVKVSREEAAEAISVRDARVRAEAFEKAKKVALGTTYSEKEISSFGSEEKREWARGYNAGKEDAALNVGFLAMRKRAKAGKRP